MKKRILALLLAGALSISLLAACGGPSDSQPDASDDGQTQTTPSPDPSDTTDPSESPDASQEPSESPDASQEPSGEDTDSTQTPSESPDASQTPSQSPSQQPSPTPTPSPEATPAPTPSPEATPAPSPSPEAPADGASLSDFYADISSRYELPSMMEVPSDVVADVYPGLESLSLNQQVLYMAAITSVASEIAIVEAADADTAAQAAAIFQARIDSQVSGGDFYPETVENWENYSQVVTCGNFVLLVVDPSYAEIAADFEAFVK